MRRAGWIAGGFLLLLGLYAAWRAFDRFLSGAPHFGADRLVLHLLILAIVVLVVGLAGVLIRNLVRLIVDRRRGILGSKLRTKLVFFFLALVLLPALVLFYGSTAVIQSSINAMLKPALEESVRQAAAVSEEWQAYLRGELLRRMGALAEVTGSPGPADLRETARREGLSFLALVEGGALGSRWADPALSGAGISSEDLASWSVALAAPGDPQPRAESRMSGSEIVACGVVPLPGSGRFLAAGAVLPRSEAARELTGLAEAYRALRAQRRDLVRFYISLVGLIFLVTVFVATWIGFTLSRRITVPIQELAAASREISEGNLGVRVATEVGDEVGTLVEAFNEMAARLQESGEVITRSTADLRRTNQALDERRRYIETLLEQLGTGVLSLDPTGRVTTSNPAAERILGVRLGPGRPIAEALGEARLAPLRDLLAGTLPPEGLRRDMGLTSAHGEAVAASVQVSPLRGSRGEALGTLVMIEDLTDLLRAQKAAAWREVARRLAHEIKNPLTPIQLAAQRLRRKWEQGSPDVADVLPEATAAIEREVGALKRLVDEFSRFARLPEVVPEPVDAASVIDSAVALYAGQAGIAWDVEVDPAVGTVRMDPEQMRRALINLIDNAIAAMGGAGRIRIAARAPEGPGSLRLEVADSGPGIPPGDRDRLFVPYFSTKSRGSGLGLAIVHRVVTDHGGTVRVEDNAPRGARFVIDLPR